MSFASALYPAVYSRATKLQRTHYLYAETSQLRSPAACRSSRFQVTAASSGNSGGGRRKRQGRARLPGMYEVEVITPPPRSLGIHALEPNTGCGDEVELEGEGCFVVSSVVLKYRLERGKYVRDHNRLEVQPTGRYFLNRMLDNIYESTDTEET